MVRQPAPVFQQYHAPHEEISHHRSITYHSLPSSVTRKMMPFPTPGPLKTETLPFARAVPHRLQQQLRSAQ